MDVINGKCIHMISLNKSCCIFPGKVALPILWTFLETWPDAAACCDADVKQIADLIQPLGLNHKRAKILMRMSCKFP
jgi:hypothetical protein